MKRYLAVIGLLISSLTISASLRDSQVRAKQLFIPIYCNGAPSGTGFPVASDLVMTAGHVGCAEGEKTSISFDGGKNFEENGSWTFNGVFDVAMLTVTNHTFKDYAKFRAPVSGESVSGFGLPYGGLLSSGIVASVGMTDPISSPYPLDQSAFVITNIPIGGMSGSAVVGEDKKVVGMVNFGLPDPIVGGTLSGGISGGVLAGLLKSFNEYRKGL